MIPLSQSQGQFELAATDLNLIPYVLNTGRTIDLRTQIIPNIMFLIWQSMEVIKTIPPFFWAMTNKFSMLSPINPIDQSDISGTKKYNIFLWGQTDQAGSESYAQLILII